jgi:hypothetical protein
VGTANLSTFQAILKDVYEGPVREQLNNSLFLLTRLAKSSDGLVGNRVVVPLHNKRSSGVGARFEDVDLPLPGNQGYVDAYYDLKYLYGAARVTGPAIAKTKSDTGAFLRALESELDRLRDDLGQDLERQVYGTGDGKIATCGVTTASTTVVLANAEALRKGQIYEGMVIDIGTIAAPQTIATAVTVNAIDINAATITISGSNVTTSGSHFVFRAGANAANTTAEVSGLRQIVADSATAFGTIDPTAAGNSFWDNLRDTTTTTLSIDKMLQLDSQVKIKGGSTSLLLTSYGVRRSYFGLLQPQVRYAEAMKLEGGFEAVDFNGKPLVADRQAPYGHLYFLDESHIKVYQNEDWHFLAEDGHPLKQSPLRDAWVAYFARYMNLGADRRNTQAVMTALTDPTGF